MRCISFAKEKRSSEIKRIETNFEKKDQQNYAAENCCVRQEMNSEANILHNEPGFVQAGN